MLRNTYVHIDPNTIFHMSVKFLLEWIWLNVKSYHSISPFLLRLNITHILRCANVHEEKAEARHNTHKHKP